MNEVHKENAGEKWIWQGGDFTGSERSVNKEKGSYLFDLRFFDFLQGNSDPFRFQFGCLFLLDKTIERVIQASLTRCENHEHRLPVCLWLWKGVELATSSNSKQPCKDFKCRSLWDDVALASSTIPVLLLPDHLPAPSNKMPSLPFCTMWLITFTQEKSVSPETKKKKNHSDVKCSYSDIALICPSNMALL